MQRLLYVVLALLAFVVLPGESSAKSFSDVKMSSEMGRAVDDLSRRGIISGYSDGTFKPNNEVTRAQAAKIVAGAVKAESFALKNPDMLAEYPEYFTPQPYKDLAVSNAYFEPVSALGEWGAMNGYEDGTFKPNNKLTRAQIAKILSRAYAIPNYDEASYRIKGKQFKDVNGESESYTFIRKMYELGIMQETSKGYFSPNQRVKRGELALYIYRLDQYFQKQAKQVTDKISVNAPGSLVAQLYAGEPVMKQQVYIGAPMHAVRINIEDTYYFGEVEGGHCASYSTFSLCGSYVWESEGIGGLHLSGNGYTVADLEELIGESIEIDVYEDGPMPYSFYFDYDGLTYMGETEGPSHAAEVLYLLVTAN